MQKVKLVFLSFLVSLFALFATTSHASELSVFGEKQYVRTTGAPNIFTETFTTEPGEARLVIRNGLAEASKGKDYRVRSGKISLNETVLFTHDDFILRTG